jgi:hypothetical protein
MLMTQFDGRDCRFDVLSVHGSLVSLAAESRALVKRQAVAGHEEATTVHAPWLH